MHEPRRATSQPDIHRVTARRTITDAQRRTRLATRHLLIPATRTDDIATIADSLVALHSTDPSTVYLSATARMEHPLIDAVSKALYDDRSVIRHHAMRRTLWVLTPHMARHAHAACTVALASAQSKRLVGMIEESGVATDGAAWAMTAKEEILSWLSAARVGRSLHAGRQTFGSHSQLA